MVASSVTLSVLATHTLIPRSFLLPALILQNGTAVLLLTDLPVQLVQLRSSAQRCSQMALMIQQGVRTR